MIHFLTCGMFGNPKSRHTCNPLDLFTITMSSVICSGFIIAMDKVNKIVCNNLDSPIVQIINSSKEKCEIYKNSVFHKNNIKVAIIAGATAGIIVYKVKKITENYIEKYFKTEDSEKEKIK